MLDVAKIWRVNSKTIILTFSFLNLSIFNKKTSNFWIIISRKVRLQVRMLIQLEAERPKSAKFIYSFKALFNFTTSQRALSQY